MTLAFTCFISLRWALVLAKILGNEADCLDPTAGKCPEAGTSGSSFLQTPGTSRQLLQKLPKASVAERTSTIRSDAEGGSILSDRLLNRFIVVPEHNLLFCYIEKVACTTFNKLFYLVRQRYDPSLQRPYHWFLNTPAKHGFNKSTLEKILKNESWHKAVFYRDPAERFVSAFESKCNHHDKDGPGHCWKQFHDSNIKFPEALRFFERRGQNSDDDEKDFDVHFMRQGSFCGGLTNTLQYYDTVEELSRKTAREKVIKLLNKVGIDENTVPKFGQLFPPPSVTNWTSNTHNTGVSSHLSTYLPPGETWRREVLTSHYRSDYELFGIPTLLAKSEKQISELMIRAEEFSNDSLDMRDSDEFADYS